MFLTLENEGTPVKGSATDSSEEGRMVQQRAKYILSAVLKVLPMT